MLLLSLNIFSQNIWINEIKYDNTGADVDDTIEVAGEAGIDLSNFSLLLYNGGTGTVYDTIALTGTIDNEDNGFGAVAFTIAGGMQNGPDGIALIDSIEDAVIQFISYEGSFTATDGLANGYSSENIGISGASSAVGFSIQLQGNGGSYSNFSWTENIAQTYNDINTGQSFSGTGSTNLWINEIKYDNTGPDVDDTIEVAGEAGINLSNFSLLLYNGGTGTVYDTITLSGFVDNEENGFGTVAFTIPGGMQNGPDGIALIDNIEDVVIQFLSYEGSFTATDGTANGYTSEDIGTSGASSAVGFSIQLQGNGGSYSNFTWVENVAQTYNDINTGQSFFGTGSINLWINEIKYDNTGADVDDTVEIAGETGIDLSDFSLLLYNGNTGTVYDTITLSGFIDNEENGFGAVAFTIPGGLQNGAPDGIALVDNVESFVVQFLSYEGSFTATDGPATFYVSEDIGISGTSTDSGFSIQLQGTGTMYSDFTWVENVAETYHKLNTNQNFPTLSINSNHIESLKIFPNPAKSNYIHINHTNSSNTTVTIYDAIGKVISRQQHVSNQIDVSHLENGLYLFEIQIENQTIIKKILIDK
jgi:hypothetical protein